MPRLLFSAFLLATAAVTPAGCQEPNAGPQGRAGAQAAPVFRHANVDVAWAAAQKSGRPVLVFVTSSNCFYCKKMVAETLSHPQIARANNERFETTLLSKEQRPELVEQLGVRAFPTTLIVNPDGSLASKLLGFVEPAKFAEQVLVAKKPGQRAASRTPVRMPRQAARR